MKILFLHLSDLHIKQNEHIEIFKIEKLVDALNVAQGFDECIIICSGDLVSTGSENEYKKVRILFGNLFAKIKNKFPCIEYLNLLLVPGNHDACFAGTKRKGENIQQYYKNNEVNQHIDEEINMLNNYFTYSGQNNCFKYEKICNVKYLNLGEYVIQVNLINTALFSTLLPDDKELHYFPNEKLSLLNKNNKANIVITVMHHSTEWFQWECKKNLEKAIYDDTSILFIGHDHNSSTKDLNFNNRNNIFISAGGEFSNDIIGKSEFSAVILNTDTDCLDSYAFEWNKKENIYTHIRLFKNKSIKIKTNKLMPNQLYIDSIKEDQKRKVTNDFTEYFVFPTLSAKNKDKYTEKVEVSNCQEFITELYKKKYINIVGGDNSGKTALLKIIYLNLLDEMLTPLLINIENIGGKYIDKIIKMTFEDQYSDDPLEYERYQQLDKSRKVAIIDDFDMIKMKKVKFDFIEILKDQFDIIIIGTKDLQEYNIIDNVRKEIDKKNDFFIFKINTFHLKKRHDLIKSICKVSNLMNDEDIENIVTTINGFVRHQFQLFDLDPDFIIQFTQYFLQNSNLQNPKNESIFNKIFETNIYNAIIKNSKKDLVDETIIALEEIAYFIHFNKRDPVSLTELQSVITKYNEDYSLTLGVRELIEVACKSKILKVDDNYLIKFCNKNHLAFFVARCLNRKFNNDGSFLNIEYLLKNICFGINDNIILFISYLTSNTKIIMLIYEASEALMKEWEDFDIDKGNITFLTKVKGHEKVNAPQNGDKEKIEQLEGKIEEDRENREKAQLIECKNLYDYDETEIDKFQYKILRALKYTEMLSKSLPNFSSILRTETKKKLIDGIYNYPNKILLKLLKSFDDNFEQIVNEIKSFADSIDARNKNDEIITKSDIETMFHSSAISIILNLYNNFAYLATERKSISMLNNYKLKNSNHKIFNLMIMDNYTISEEFSRKAEDIYDNTEDKNIKLLIQYIVRKHLIYTENIKYSERQHLIDKFLGQKEIKTFLVKTPKENI